jgi:hypothetical protein
MATGDPVIAQVFYCGRFGVDHGESELIELGNPIKNSFHRFFDKLFGGLK